MFSPYVSTPFELFGPGHIAVLVLFILAAAGLLLFRFRLRESTFLKETTRCTFFTALVLSEVSFQIWAVAAGVWNAREYIPIELCSISTYFALFILLTKKEKWFGHFYFLGLLPPMLAMLTPELYYGFPHYMFLRFFLQHMIIPLTVFFFMFVYQYRPSWRSLFQSILFLNVYAIPIFAVNRLIGANYLFLAGAPEVKTPLDYLGSGVWYYVHLELIVFGSFALLYAPFLFKDKKIKTKKPGDVEPPV
ncbi:TIGR02206 family membrane protein [Bacillus marinisedimentorum]|uniref:YwaF family protein n=1 Tax=Bacillus marinisedimentorum TaxID=1821260 RepID=UPI000872B9BB|nr:TIGR02206 family membrane protein [Bacillus marinisedimentorum]